MAAVPSLLVQGLELGTSNNSFHLAILLRLYDLPQFADDAHVQLLALAALATLLACALFLRRRPPSPALGGAGLFALFAVSVAAADHDRIDRTVGDFPTDVQLDGLGPAAPDWLEVGRWARAGTPAEAVFMIPRGLLDFGYASRRRVWSNREQGAAAMWSPGFHARWCGRQGEAAALPDLPVALRYACGQGIDYVVTDQRPPDPDTRGPLVPSIAAAPDATQVPVYDNRWFRIFAVPPCPVPS